MKRKMDSGTKDILMLLALLIIVIFAIAAIYADPCMLPGVTCVRVIP